MVNIPHIKVRELAYKIKDSKDDPRFAFFLGAGASRQSGIITAGEMIADFRKRLIDRLCPDELNTQRQKDKWLREQKWYPKPDDEYSKLFEKLEPKEYGRRDYIRHMIDRKEPSFGYAVLANLMASNFINTIITTNFDDLVYKACSSYTSIRPTVYAYGHLAPEMRMDKQHHNILKMHGDYLYSPLKNTKKELKSQDPNMVSEVLQVLGRYGLVVVGYSGDDDSVMNVLEEISHKHDLYWCIRENTKTINPRVKGLLKKKHGFLVEIQGFDEMMDKIREIVKFDVNEIFGSVQARQDHILEKIQDFPDEYAVGLLTKIVEILQEEHKLARPRAEKRLMDVKCLSLFTQGRKARNDEDFAKAGALFQQVIDINPQYKRAHNNLGITLQDRGRKDEAEDAYRKEINFNPKDTHAYSNLIKLLRSQDRDGDALEIAEKALRNNDERSFELFISLVALHKGLGNTSEADQYAADARKELPPDAWYHLASLECVSGNVEAAIKNLKFAADDKDFDPVFAMEDPDLKLIRNDPRFEEIVGDKNP